jgi:hypothetical protein
MFIGDLDIWFSNLCGSDLNVFIHPPHLCVGTTDSDYSMSLDFHHSGETVAEPDFLRLILLALEQHCMFPSGVI